MAAAGNVESVYRQDGDRLWRALYAFAGAEDVASAAVAEAFAHALRRGSAIRDVLSWVWRSASCLPCQHRLRLKEFARWRHTVVKGRSPSREIAEFGAAHVASPSYGD